MRAVHQEKEIKGVHLGEKEVHLTLFSNDMNIHRENTKNLTNEKKKQIFRTDGTSLINFHDTKSTCKS